MQSFLTALATALLLWAGTLLTAQPLKKHVLHGFSKAIDTTSADSSHTKKTAFKNPFFQNIPASLGNKAGEKMTGPLQRENDSLQQIILLRKKF